MTLDSDHEPSITLQSEEKHKTGNCVIPLEEKLSSTTEVCL